VTWYAGARDFWEIAGGELVLYPEWASIRRRAERDVADADAAMVTSFCPDGIDATDVVLDAARALRCFYDLDTPVTLSKLQAGQTLSYIGAAGLSGFDLVFSYTGGVALDLLRSRLGAKHVLPLYGHVDPEVHRPAPPLSHYRSDLSYLGTWSADRQAAVEALLVEPARSSPDRRFLVAGAQYPHDFPWAQNIYFVRHLPPGEHPAFFSSSRLTLNVTREAMAEMGWCPSGRLFEAAACGAPILSDVWEGLECFYAPGEDILVARRTDDTLSALDLADAELGRIAARARERTLAEHTSAARAEELLTAVTQAEHRSAAAAIQEA
jgi:spore maturation protein CgeB